MRHVYYISYYESPLGLIEINTSDYAVLAIKFVSKEGEYPQENMLSIRIKNELDSYFKGELTSFSFYNYLISGLEARVLEVISHIPYGETMTYKEVASFLGNEKVTGPVKEVLRNNPCPILLPCHRVIENEEEIGEYVTSEENKRYLLEFEQKNKVTIVNN